MIDTSKAVNQAASTICLFLLFLTLMVLKLVGVTPDLSWWVVTAPLWGPVTIMIAIVIVVLLCLVARAAFRRQK